VITEAVMLPRNVDAYLDALEGITVYFVGVRCPLGVAQRRERERTDRGSGPLDLAIPDFDLVHAERPYDVEFDTSVTSIAEAAALIREALTAGGPPTAFDVLRSQRVGRSASDRTSPRSSWSGSASGGARAQATRRRRHNP
jgi:chloramphenicol 3-O phosphotransferase